MTRALLPFAPLVHRHGVLGERAAIATAARLARAMDARDVNTFDSLSGLERGLVLAGVAGLARAAPCFEPEIERERQVGTTSLLVRLISAERRGALDTAVAEAAWRTLRPVVDGGRTRGITEAALAALYGRRDKLPVRLRADVDRRVRATTKASPPYSAWDGPDGVRRIRIALQAQDEFYPAWIPFLEEEMGFTLADVCGQKRTYRRATAGPGQRTEIEVVLDEVSDHIFAPMGDPRMSVVVWSGHSDWWARVHRDLESAPAQAGDKVLANLMCFGAHFLQDLRAFYPEAHLVTSKLPIEDPEEHAAFSAMIHGFEAGQSWRAIRDVARHDPRNPEDNIIFPCDLPDFDQVLDRDGDGICDVIDTVPDFTPPEQVGKISEADFVPASRPERGVSGRKVLEAALLLNSVAYDHELLDLSNPDQRVLAAGYFTPSPDDDRIIELCDTENFPSPKIHLRLNELWAHAHPAAVVGLATFEGTLVLLGRQRANLSTVDRVLAAIGVLAHIVDNDRYPYGAFVFEQTLRRYHLPVLPLEAVLETVAANEDWESGSWATIAALAALLTPEQRANIEAFAPRLQELDRRNGLAPVVLTQTRCRSLSKTASHSH